MSVSIIIVNYNTASLVLDAINSIKKFTNIEHEIIIVDNDSNDKYCDEFSQINDKNVKFIYSNENLGFGKANNLGVINSKYDNLFFLNPDTYLVEDSISIMLEILNDENVGIVGCNLVKPDMSENHSYGKYETNLRNLKKTNCLIFKLKERIFRKKISFSFNYGKENIEVGYVCGAALMMKKSIFNAIGGFDKDIFMYSEEDELCYFTKKMGYKVLNTPKTKIVHLEGASFSKTQNFNTSRYIRYVDGAYIYFTKCFGKDSANKYLDEMIKIYRKKKMIFFLFKHKKNEFEQKIEILRKKGE